MKWYIIDDKNGDLYEQEIIAQDRGEAIEIARSAWNGLTKHDKEQRVEFAVAYADTEADGCVDYDSVKYLASFKNARGECNPVFNAHMRVIDFDSAVELMDDDLREELHAEGVDTEQWFIDMYCQRHLEKYGEEFEPNKDNPVW